MDGLILVCAGAGGHAGALSPFALLREVKKWFDGTVILSGSIGDGHAVASAIALGADVAAMARPMLLAADQNAEEIDRFIEETVLGLKVAMFGIGADHLDALRYTPLLHKLT